MGENSNATILELKPLHGRHLQWDTGLLQNQLRHGFSVLSVRREWHLVNETSKCLVMQPNKAIGAGSTEKSLTR